jgi:hypothetical protein
MRYRVVHRTTYEYAQPVSVCHNLFHLRPREVEGQTNESTTVTVTPAPAVLSGAVGTERDSDDDHPRL